MRKIVVAMLLAALATSTVTTTLTTTPAAAAPARPAANVEAPAPALERLQLRWDRRFTQRFVRHFNARHWEWVRARTEHPSEVGTMKRFRRTVGRVVYRPSQCYANGSFSVCYVKNTRRAAYAVYLDKRASRVVIEQFATED